MSEPQTTENPAPKEGDPASPESPPKAEGDRPGESKETDWKALALSYKSKVERVNEVEAENQSLKARLQPPAASEDEDPELSHYQDVQRLIAEAKAQGQAVPKWAAADKARFERARQMETVIQAVFEAAPEETKEVLKEYAQNPHLYASPKAAETAIKARKLEAENVKLREDVKRLSTNRVPADTVSTEGREGPKSAPTTVQNMTRAEWQERQGKLSDAERMEDQRLRRLGRIVVP